MFLVYPGHVLVLAFSPGASVRRWVASGLHLLNFFHPILSRGLHWGEDGEGSTGAVISRSRCY